MPQRLEKTEHYVTVKKVFWVAPAHKKSPEVKNEVHENSMKNIIHEYGPSA